MANGGGSALQELVYNLRITANTEGVRQASQAFQQVSKQADRAANEMARSFGPKMAQGWQQARQRTVEMGKSLVAVGNTVDKVDPKFRRMGLGLQRLGEAQEAAGISGTLNSKMLRDQAAHLSRTGLAIEKTISARQRELKTVQRTLVSKYALIGVEGKDQVALQSTIASLEAEEKALMDNIRLRQLYGSTLKQGSTELAIFAEQTDQARDSMGSFTGEATMVQKAGQGMILSFSAAQMAAGNFQQGLFGLGFSLMFVGKSIIIDTAVRRAWTAVVKGNAGASMMLAGALATTPLAFAAIATAIGTGLPMLIKWLTASEKMEPVTEIVSRRMEELKERIAEATGELKLMAEEIRPLIEELGVPKYFELSGLQETTENIEKVREVVDQLHLAVGGSTPVNDWTDAWKYLSQTLIAMGADIKATTGAQGEYVEMTKDGLVTEEEFAKLLALVGINLEEYKKGVEEASEAAKDFAASIREEAMEALSDFWKQVAASAAREELIKPFKIDIEGVRDEYEALEDAAREATDAATEAVQEGLDVQTEAIRDGLQDQTTAMREAAQERQDIIKDALDDELDVIREAAQERQDVIRDALDDELDAIREQAQDRQDAIKDALDTETEAIKDAADDRIDIIRDQLKDELDAIKDAAGDRVDAVKDAASDEIDVHKERISALRDMERSLAKELSDLASRRQELVAEAMTTQAEIAALEAAQAQFGGDDPRLAAEIALREARLAALAALDADAQAAQAAAQEQADATEGQIEDEEAAIEAVEDRRDAAIDAIEDARDAAIEAARDAADARIEAEEDARDAAIEAAKEAAEEKVKADKKATDAVIEGAQDAAKEKIKADKKVTDTAIENAQGVANEKIKEDTKATNNAITEAQREARERIKEAGNVADEAIKEIDRVGEEALKQLGLEEEARIDNIEKAQDQAEEDADRAIIMRDEVLPGLRAEWVLLDQILQQKIAATTDEKERVRLQEERNRLLRNYLALTSGIEHGPEADISVPYGPAFQKGGIVPGPPSRAVPIIAHGEEAILRPDQFRFLNQNLADASALAAGLRENMQGINQPSVDKQRSDEERKLRNAQEAILREQEVILRWQEAILRQSGRQAATPPEQVATIVSKRETTAESRALEEQARKIQEQMAEDEARRDRERDARDREQGDRNRSQAVVQPAAPGPVNVSIVVNARSDYELGKAEKMINKALGAKVDLAVRTRRMAGR